MENITELIPNKNIELFSQFEGFKLSNNSLTLHEFPIINGIKQALPNNDQYSFLHMRLFNCYNHLFFDPWTKPRDVYFIDRENKVYKIIIDNDEKIKATINVWEVPKINESQPGDFNFSLVFPSDDFALVSNGSGTVFVINAEKRNADCGENSWKCLFSVNPCDTRLPFSLIHGIKTSTSHIHFLLLRIAESRKKKDNKDSSNFCSILEWITLEKGELWIVKRRRQIEITGPVYSAIVETEGEAVYIAAEGNIEFIDKPGNDEEQSQKQLPLYYWWQTNDDITLQLPLPANLLHKSQIKVEVKGQNLSIRIKNELILEGNLTNLVDPNLVTWSIEDKSLSILLTKNFAGQMWTNLLPISSGRGEQLAEPGLAETIHQHLAHLTSDKPVRDASGVLLGGNDELEECDEPPNNIFRLVRLENESNQITNQINLTGHQWICEIPDTDNNIPMFCLRYGDDGFIWQCEKFELGNPWKCKHEMVFPAFGYIHAGKPKRKFTFLSTNFLSACIIENLGQLYIYHHPNSSQNTHSKQKNFQSVHQVFNMKEEILGFYVDQDYGFILTQTKIFLFFIN